MSSFMPFYIIQFYCWVGCFSDDEKIIHYLKLVGLERLLDRLGGIDAQTNWNWYVFGWFFFAP